MVAVIVGINLVIAMLCWYVAWQLWLLRRTLANVAEALLIAERNTHNVLYGAPDAIATAQQGSYQLRQSYQRLRVQISQLQRILSLVAVGQTFWVKWRSPKGPRRSPQRGRSPNSPRI